MKNDNFTVYGQPSCTFCSAAKVLLDQKGLTYKYVDISLPENASQKEFIVSTGARTVPQIYQGEDDSGMTYSHHVGGFEELSKLLKDTPDASA